MYLPPGDQSCAIGLVYCFNLGSGDVLHKSPSEGEGSAATQASEIEITRH